MSAPLFRRSGRDTAEGRTAMLQHIAGSCRALGTRHPPLAGVEQAARDLFTRMNGEKPSGPVPDFGAALAAVRGLASVASDGDRRELDHIAWMLTDILEEQAALDAVEFVEAAR